VDDLTMTSGEVRLMNLAESVRAQRLERFFTVTKCEVLIFQGLIEHFVNLS
jgi:hypothetical protein